MKHTITCFLLVIFLSAASSAGAAPVLSFNEATGSSANNGNQSVGWQFDVLSALNVTDLSWFDAGADGLAMDHLVGIWDSSGVLLTSVLIPSGTVASLEGQFRTVAIPNLSLTPGIGYIVGGQNFSSNTERLASDVEQVIDSRIGFVDATYSGLNGIFERPTQFSIATTGFFGPSFSISAAGVPDSGSTLALFGLALVGCLGIRRRFSR